MIVIGPASHLVFMGRNSEQQDAGNACFQDPVQLFAQAVYGILADSGHGIYGITDMVPFNDKNRINQFIHPHMILPHQAPHGGTYPQPPHSLHLFSSFILMLQYSTDAKGNPVLRFYVYTSWKKTSRYPTDTSLSLQLWKILLFNRFLMIRNQYKRCIHHCG